MYRVKLKPLQGLALVVMFLLSGESMALTLGEFLEEVEENNPAVLSAEEGHRAKEALVLPAGWLDDPTLTYQMMFLDDAYGLAQPVPFPTKLWLRRSLSRHEAERGYEMFRSTRLAVSTKAKVTFYEYAYVDESIQVIQKNLDIFRTLLEVAREKYETGGEIWDPLRAEVEVARLENQLVVLGAKKDGLQVRLNALRNRPPDDPIGSVTLFALEEIELPPLEQMREVALEERPALKTHLAEVKKAQDRAGISLWSFAPDLVPQVRYRTETRDFDFSLGFRIPLWFLVRETQEARASQKMVRSHKASYENMKNHTLADLGVALSEWTAARSDYETHEGVIVPRSLEALQAAQSGYMAGRLDFLTLINSETNALLAELSLWRAYTNMGKAIALLEGTLGKEPWSRGEDL